MTGKVVALSEVPDKAFSDKSMGDGVAIIPEDDYEDDIEESQFFVLFDIQRLTTLLEDQFGNNAKQAEKLSKIKDMKDIVIKGNQFHVEFYLHMMPGKKVSESVLDLASQVCK